MRHYRRAWRFLAGFAGVDFRSGGWSGAPAFFLLRRVGTDKAFWRKADQICPACLLQRLAHEKIILRSSVLHQRALHRLFVRIFGHIDRLHRPGVKAGIVHDGGERRGRGIEILHLLRLVVGIAQVFGQLYGLLHRAAGVGRHEIGYDVLLHALLLVDLFVFFHELLVDAVRGACPSRAAPDRTHAPARPSAGRRCDSAPAP